MLKGTPQDPSGGNSIFNNKELDVKEGWTRPDMPLEQLDPAGSEVAPAGLRRHRRPWSRTVRQEAGGEVGKRFLTADAAALQRPADGRRRERRRAAEPAPGVPPMFAFRDQDGNGLEIVQGYWGWTGAHDPVPSARSRRDSRPYARSSRRAGRTSARRRRAAPARRTSELVEQPRVEVLRGDVRAEDVHANLSPAASSAWRDGTVQVVDEDDARGRAGRRGWWVRTSMPGRVESPPNAPLGSVPRFEPSPPNAVVAHEDRAGRSASRRSAGVLPPDELGEPRYVAAGAGDEAAEREAVGSTTPGGILLHP